MGVKQSVGRSCDCFQDTKTPEKTHFLKLVFRRFFHPIQFYGILWPDLAVLRSKVVLSEILVLFLKAGRLR